VINNNLILEVPGDLDGLPNDHQKFLNGIYLDMGLAGVSVTGNTVKGATHSIVLHNNSQTTISDNIFYGSTRGLLWMYEEPTTAGVLFGNTVTNNQFFPTLKDVSIYNTSISGNVFKFSTYSNNHYSTIYSPIIASEYGVGFTSDYTFLDWQKAKTTAGLARNNDLNGDTPAPLPSFAQGTVGLNFTSNSDFSAGLDGWGHYNVVMPYADIILEGCLPVSVNCMHVIAGASETTVISPKFGLTKGKFYRVTFDLKATFDNAFLYPKIRFAGPKYDDLAITPRYATSTEWERHSFVFEATDTAADPATNAQSARFDIDGLPAGQSLWIANLEIAPFDFGVFGPTTSELLVNTTDLYKAMDCPTLRRNPGLCSNYVTFPEGTVAVWPISVAPRSGRIVFTQNLALLDSDGDGIANSQDKCSNTIKGLEVNGRGCSLLD
jgi:parallel beta-helix repeat protein